MPAGKFDLIGEIRLAGPVNLTATVNKIQSQLSGVTANVRIKVDKGANRSLTTLNTKFISLSKNIKIANQSAKDLSATVSALSFAFSKLQSRSVKNTATQTKQLAKNLRTTKKAAEESADAIEDFGAKTSLALKRFAAYTFATTVIFGLVRAFQSSVSEAINFERSLVKVEQATRTSTRNIQKLNDEITRLAKNFGVSSGDLVEVSRTLSQAGLKVNEVQNALQAIAKSNLAPTFGDITDTTEGAIAAMNQFGIEVDQLEGVLGSINAVAANFAVESEGIISAIRRAGGVFAAASEGAKKYNAELGEFQELTNTEKLNQFIALFTAVKSTTRESNETIATGLRTISTRLQRPSTITALQGVGIDLTDQEGKFVGVYEAVNRLNEGLSKLDKRDPKFGKIAEELSGFRQIGKLIPLIFEYAKAQDALQVAQQGTNSLEEDAQTALKSLAVQIEKTKENFKAFVREFVESDTFKIFAGQILGVANSFIEVARSLKPLIPIFSLIAGFKAVSSGIKFTRGFFGGGAGGNNPADINAALSNSTKTQNISSAKLLLATNSTNNILTNILREVATIRSSTVGKTLKNNFSRVPFTGFNPSDSSISSPIASRKLSKIKPSSIDNSLVAPRFGVLRDINRDPDLLNKIYFGGINPTRVRNIQTQSGFQNSISQNIGQLQGPLLPNNRFFSKKSKLPTFKKLFKSGGNFASNNQGGVATGLILASSLASGGIKDDTATGAGLKGALSGGAAGAGIGLSFGGPIGAAVGAAAGSILGFATSLDAFNEKKSLSKFEESIKNAVESLSKADISLSQREAIIASANSAFVERQGEKNQSKKLLGDTGSKITTFGATGIADFLLKQLDAPSLGDIFYGDGLKKIFNFDRSPELAKIGEQSGKDIAAQIETFGKTEEKILRDRINKQVSAGKASGQNITSGEIVKKDILSGNLNSVSSAVAAADPTALRDAQTSLQIAITQGIVGEKDFEGQLDFVRAKILQFADLETVFRDIDVANTFKEIQYQIDKMNKTFDVLSGVIKKFNDDLSLTIKTFDQAENSARGIAGSVGFSNPITRDRNVLNNPLGVTQKTFQGSLRNAVGISGGNQVVGKAANLLSQADNLERNLLNIFERANNFKGQYDKSTPENAAANIIRSEFGGLIGESVAQKIENVLAPREAGLDEIKRAFESGDLLKDIPELDKARKVIDDLLSAFENGAQLIDEEISKFVSAQDRYNSAILDAEVANISNRRLIDSVRNENTRTNVFDSRRDINRLTTLRAGPALKASGLSLSDALLNSTSRLSNIQSRVSNFDPSSQSITEFTALADEARITSDNITRFRSAIEFAIPALDDYKNQLVKGIEDLRRQSSEARSFFVNFASSDASSRRQTITDLGNASIAARGGVLPLGPDGVGSAFRGIDALSSFNPEIADQLKRKTLVNQFQAAGVDLNQKTLVEGPGGEFLTLKEVLLGGSKPEERMVAELELIADQQSAMRDALVSIEANAAAIARGRFDAVAANPIDLQNAGGSVNPKTGEIGNVNFNQGISKLEETLKQLNETEIQIAGEITANVNLTGGDELSKLVAEKIAGEIERIINRSTKETTDQIMGRSTAPRGREFANQRSRNGRNF